MILYLEKSQERLKEGIKSHLLVVYCGGRIEVTAKQLHGYGTE